MKLSYDVYSPSGGHDVNKFPVILLHGRLDSKKTWEKFASVFSEKTSREVFALDTRNHGDSPWSSEMDFEILANDLDEFMKDHDIPKAILVGHSMGGRIAITFTLNKPDKVEKLIVEDVTVEGYSLTVRDNVLQLISLMRKSLDAIPQECDDVTAKKAVYDFVKSFLPPTGSFMFSSDTLALKKTSKGYSWQANLDVLEDMLKHRSLQALTGVYEGDVLFLYGSKSMFHVDKDESITKYFPHAVKVPVEGAGHLVHQDYPDVFLKEVLNFV